MSRETFEVFAKEHDLTVVEASASSGNNVELVSSLSSMTFRLFVSVVYKCRALSAR